MMKIEQTIKGYIGHTVEGKEWDKVFVRALRLAYQQWWYTSSVNASHHKFFKDVDEGYNVFIAMLQGVDFKFYLELDKTNSVRMLGIWYTSLNMHYNLVLECGLAFIAPECRGITAYKTLDKVAKGLAKTEKCNAYSMLNWRSSSALETIYQEVK